MRGTFGVVKYRQSTLSIPQVKQFRSPTEFAPRAVWLLTDPTLDPSNCGCKYCRKDVGCPHKSRIQRDRSETPTTVASLSSHSVCRSTPSIPQRRIARSTSYNAPEYPPRSIRRQPSLRKISPQQENSEEEAPIPSHPSCPTLSHYLMASFTAIKNLCDEFSFGQRLGLSPCYGNSLIVLRIDNSCSPENILISAYNHSNFSKGWGYPQQCICALGWRKQIQM